MPKKCSSLSGGFVVLLRKHPKYQPKHQRLVILARNLRVNGHNRIKKACRFRQARLVCGLKDFLGLLQLIKLLFLLFQFFAHLGDALFLFLD
jgi:hypothetical protein